MIFSGPKKPPGACAPLSPQGDKTRPPGGATVNIDGTTTTIDVRGLEAPEPLVAILTLLESPQVTDTVIVVHDRDPLLLYPELEERGWTWSPLPSPEGELHLRLTREAGN